MSKLEAHINKSGLDETKTMNLLQSNGIISDNCISSKDVSDADCEKAVQHLKKINAVEKQNLWL